jgi:hypothetical protein
MSPADVMTSRHYYRPEKSPHLQAASEQAIAGIKG